MSFPRSYHGQGRYPRNDGQSLVNRTNSNQYNRDSRLNHFSQNISEPVYNGRSNEDIAPPYKRTKYTESTWGNNMGHYQQYHSMDNVPSTSTSFSSAPTGLVEKNCTVGSKRDRENFEDEAILMSRDEIERLSPSRKDGIDPLRETYLRYSYCAYLQNLGMRLELPQTTIGTAMVLCHRFFVRQSHACHDRFMIATAALFLAAKSEETARPLNDVLKASCEVCHKQGFNFFPNLLPVDWFEQYRERVTDAEHIILTTLNFELNVQHPYSSLISVLDKLGLSQSVLVNLSSCLVSEGLRSSLWLQFKPHHIAAGAAYLAAKFMNFDFHTHQMMLKEFETTPSILQDVVKQLMELF